MKTGPVIVANEFDPLLADDNLVRDPAIDHHPFGLRLDGGWGRVGATEQCGCPQNVLVLFLYLRYRLAMADDEGLTLADPKDLADAIAFALQFSGRKRAHDADEFMAKIAAERIVRHLENARYVVMKKPPIGGGGDNPGRRGFEH
jgi:hypothetical protein